MLKRDFLMKQIEEMVRALAVVLGLKKAGKFDEARQKTDEMLHDFLQGDLASLNEIPTAELMNKLYHEQKLHEEQVSIVADCFMQEGEMQSEEGNIEAARNYFEKALVLFEGLNHLPKATFSMERMQKIAALKKHLDA
jgi:tetratricopeptide (TPR) repeat protein